MKIKKHVYAFCFVILFSNVMHTQKLQGIYLHAKDFENDSLSFSCHDCKINLHLNLQHKPIKIKCRHSIFYFSKDSVYGYKDKEGICYRFYKHINYDIMHRSDNIILYALKTGNRTKYDAPTYEYFFSQTAESRMLPISIANLEKVYNNKRFMVLLETYFKKNDDLLEYDTTHHTYKIERLFELSKINL